MTIDFQADIAAINDIKAVPTILEVVCSTTGMGFAAVVRVTEDRWIACTVLDKIDFGLKSGGELRIETTICDEIRQSREPIVIDHVAEDAVFYSHHTPAMYGFQSYVSMPIILKDGSFFGTLCAVDPRPARLKNPQTIGMFKLFAELIAFHIDANAQLASSEASLLDERKTSEFREQFIAVLGHDLRNPVASIDAGTRLLLKMPLNDKATGIVTLIQGSATRMSGLINDLLDFARGRLGGGITVDHKGGEPLAAALHQVIAELGASCPTRTIEVDFDLRRPVDCDSARIAQLFSNLLGNALKYGAGDAPIRVQSTTTEGTFQLSVANAGDPIPPAALERLFQPFTRGVISSNKLGLGLGLYIASEIARAHGGTLTVASSSEETRFTFKMPLR